MYPTTVDTALRALIETARRKQGLTQQEAARRAGIDPSWWKKLASGRRTETRSGTIAAMAHAVGVTPEALEKLNQPHAAQQLRILLTQGELPELDLDDAEAHLAATPGTTPGEREALILHLRELRHRHTNRRAEPFEQDFVKSKRR